ncbi:DNA cross-link repair protein snm1 [Cochliomyia hominivorax]
MIQTTKIKIRDIKELQDDKILLTQNIITPLKKCKKPKYATTTKKRNLLKHDDNNIKTSTITKTTTKKLLKSTIKETPANQKLISSYFSCCPKTYDIKLDPAITPFRKQNSPQTAKTSNKQINNKTKQKTKKSPSKPRKIKRKRLFSDTTEPKTDHSSMLDSTKNEKKKLPVEECITIDSSDSEDDQPHQHENSTVTTIAPPVECLSILPSTSEAAKNARKPTTPSNTNLSCVEFGLRMTNSSCFKTPTISKSNNSSSSSVASSVPASFSRRKPKPCPPYKVIEGTTFAVDAFQFGYIDNVSDYFLTHFHADHYIGLTKSFAKPVYMSEITARLVRTFIGIEEQYIKELMLNKTYTLNNIEITALDANHCPGAILLVFKFLDTGKCILHTGDFRAWRGMESEPIFWNNDIHTIYLDTTYISDKYAFCTQDESIDKAKQLIEQYREKNPQKRILYICGTYIVGKENFWSKIAEEYELKVWAEGNRYKALKAINDERYNRFLVEEPEQANMHVIAMGKLTYFELVDYFKAYEHLYDAVFAIRPSGWEKDTKPRFSGKINLVGIEYSEHSSYAEMQRFVKFLKPLEVISTVPTGKDLMKTAKVPLNWYKYDKLKVTRSYQPTIDSVLGKTPLKKSSIRLPNINKGGVDNFVSPLKNNNNLRKNNTSSTKLPVINNGENEKEDEEIFIENPIKIENEEKPMNKIITKRSTISSEDFENPDVVLAINKTVIKNKKLNKKDMNVKEKIKEKHVNNKTKQDSSSALNSDDLFEVPNVQVSQKKPPVIKKDIGQMKSRSNKRKVTKASPIKDDKLPTSSQVNEENSEVPLNNGRATTRSKSNSNNSNTSSKQQQHNNKNNINETKSIPSNTSLENSKKTDERNSEISFDKIRITRSKSNPQNSNTSSKKYVKSLDEAQTTEQKPSAIKQPQSQTQQLLIGSHKNPLLKSTTTTSIDSKASDELTSVQIPKSRLRKRTTNTLPASERSSEDMEHLIKPKKSKQQKNSENNKLDTKAILENILEETDYEDRFNCSQLACKVIETLEKQYQDNSKDHIPPELLSNEDDEDDNSWQTAPPFKQEILTQKDDIQFQLSQQPTTSSAVVIVQTQTFNDNNFNKSQPQENIENLSIKENQENVLLKSTSSSSHHSNPSEEYSSNEITLLEHIPTTLFKKSKKRFFNTNFDNDSLEKMDDDENMALTEHTPSRYKREKNKFNLKFNKNLRDTKNILNDILETKEDYNDYNLSQLAGLVVETQNKQNPNNSKDHLPIDLLSDADDDWM